MSVLVYHHWSLGGIFVGRLVYSWYMNMIYRPGLFSSAYLYNYLIHDPHHKFEWVDNAHFALILSCLGNCDLNWSVLQPPATTYNSSAPITGTQPKDSCTRKIGFRANWELTVRTARLSTAERTGSRVFHALWSYVLIHGFKGYIYCINSCGKT